MVSGHTQAMDRGGGRSAPVKANASMESLELKRPFQSIERHFEALDSENQEPVITTTPSTVGLITAPQHHLNRVKHVHDKLRKNPVGASGASHEKAQLFSNKTHYSPNDDHYRRAHHRQLSKRGYQMKRLRQSTVEPVFGSLVYHYGLKKINVIGKAGAHKVMLMAPTCFSLKNTSNQLQDERKKAKY
jgi:hypothetical protein